MDQRGICPLLHLLAQDCQRIRLGVAGVDHHGQPGLARDPDMAAEQRLLDRAVGLVVIVIQPGLADGDDPWVPRRLQQGPLAQIGMGIGLVRVDAHAGPDIPLALGHGDHRLPFTLAGRNVEKTSNSGRPRPRQHPGLILDQPFVIEVAV